MSRAFTKEEAPSDPVFVPPRPPLPQGATNYVTPRGLALLRAEHDELDAERTRLHAEDEGDEIKRQRAAVTGRLANLAARIGSARVLDPSTQPPDEVRFGATVTLLTEDGTERRFTIVGVDEAATAPDRVAFFAPIARAVVGHRVGDAVTLRTPRGEERLMVSAITYESGEAKG